MSHVNVVADLHKIGEDLISMNNLVSHLSMECSKRIKCISLNLIGIIHQVTPPDTADLEGIKLSDEETLEIVRIDGICQSLHVSLSHLSGRKQGIIEAASKRAEGGQGNDQTTA